MTTSTIRTIHCRCPIRLARLGPLLAVVLISAMLSNSTAARDYKSEWSRTNLKRQTGTISSASRPTVMYASHRRGRMQLAIANNGTFGTFGSNISDPFTGGSMMSCTYPRGDNIVYLWVGSIWIGAVIGRDTVVSTGSEDFYNNEEFWPEISPDGDIKMASINVNSPYYDPSAYSEEDIIAVYFDTVTDPGLVESDLESNRPHQPLGIKITQRSMAWSYAYADDFILFNYDIKNIGPNRLRSVYMGIWVDGDVWHTSRNGPEGWNDDIVGFLRDHPAPEGCGFMDTVNVAWTADNDGDPDQGAWDYRSAKNVVGTRVVRTPSDSLNYSYNWWIINYSDATYDFGPRLNTSANDPFRSFPSGRLGTPVGDRDKYYLLRHKEFDYDLLTTALDHTSEGFLPPPELAETYAIGFDTRYLLSFGPFNIDPGQSLPISLAWVGGENLHREATDFETLFDPSEASKVKQYYEALDFSNLALNSRWASWVYDNPGRDTDGDGYFGKFRVCNFDSVLLSIDTIYDPSLPGGMLIDSLWEYTAADTFYTEGDGVPDFEGASPPPAPMMRLIPSDGKLIVRWNGYYSENTKDAFLNLYDFEGYKVYIGLDGRESSLTTISSFDLEDYNRLRWTRLSSGDFGWRLEETPFTLNELRSLYNDPEFRPLSFTRQSPLFLDDERYYFEPQGFNQSNLSFKNGIHKVFPDEPHPGLEPSEWSVTELTDGYDSPMPKYWEYEYILNDLLPTVPYFVAVTAFDYGSPASDLTALETNPLNNMIQEYAQVASGVVESEGLAAYVYPNPYIGDGNYARVGFEGRNDPLFGPRDTDRIRRLHFTNLPRECTIAIYSIDGDLIRTWEHSFPEGGPGSNHSTWDLISRNTQAVVSGIYYFVVKTDMGAQIGKFVIIK